MDLNILATITVSLIMIATGIAVYLKNKSSTVNKLFAFNAFSAAVYTFVYRFIEIHDPVNMELSRLFNSLAYAVALIMIYSTALLTFYHPRKLPNSYHLKYLALFSIPLFFLSFTPLVAGTVEYDYESGLYIYEYTLGMIPYALVILYAVTLIVRNLYVGYKTAHTKKYKLQVKYMITGTVITSTLTVFLAIVWPFIYPENQIDELAPFTLIFMLFFSAKSIIQTRLFDFKVVSSRVISYLITILLSIAIYFIADYLIQNYAPSGDERTLRIIFGTIFTAVLILLFYVVESKIYNYIIKLISPDVYDPQNLIDHLNKSIVSSQELETLLQAVANSVTKTLNSSFCGFYIRETSYFENRFISNTGKKLRQEDLENIRRLIQKIRYKIHSTEVEPANDEEVLMNEILENNDVEILGKLVDTTDYEVAGIGFMLIGPKRSGSVYSEQDIKILEIIVNELVIAIENALKLEEIELFNATLQKKD